MFNIRYVEPSASINPHIVNRVQINLVIPDATIAGIIGMTQFAIASKTFVILNFSFGLSKFSSIPSSSKPASLHTAEYTFFTSGPIII